MYSRGSIAINITRLIILIPFFPYLFVFYLCAILLIWGFSTFFHMQSTKIYHLAVPPSQLPFAKALALTDSSLPTGNIFAEGRRKWHAGKNLDSTKGYDIVGLKELKSYRNRLKKASRATIRIDSLSTQRALSKASSEIKKTSRELLTKEEVYESVPQLQREQVRPAGIKKRVKRKRQSWMTFSTDLEQNPTQMITREGRALNITQGSDFSVGRVKRRMEEHRQEWSKRHYQEGGKFPDIYRSIQLHRLKVQDRANGKPHEELVVTRSKLWGETLRDGKSMKEICSKRDFTRTIHDENSFMARGHSKIAAEKQWLQRKEESGFRFKMHPVVCTDDLKKTVLYR